MKWVVGYLLGVLVASGAVWFVLDAKHGSELRQPMPVGLVSFGSKLLIAQFTQNTAHVQQGLMGRAVKAPEGMVFDFMGSKACFWMKGTPSPLSAAWLDGSGKVLGTVEMHPNTLDIHCGPPGTRFGVEAVSGFFAASTVGLTAVGLRFAATKVDGS